MNKSFLKFITDFGPLLIFFTIYYKSGNNLKAAIPPLIISTLIAVALMYVVEKKIPYVPLIGAVVISLFGGLTLYFDNKIFFYMKPTIINLMFAGALFFGKYFTQKPILVGRIYVLGKPLCTEREGTQNEEKIAPDGHLFSTHSISNPLLGF